MNTCGFIDAAKAESIDALVQAGRLKVDGAAQTVVADHIYLQRVQEHMQSGERLGLRSTPAFYVNGVFTDVSFGLQHLHEAIDKALRTR